MTSPFHDPWLDNLASKDAKDGEAEAVRAYYRQRSVEETSPVNDAAREIRMFNYLRARNAFAPKSSARQRFSLPHWLSWLTDMPRMVPALAVVLFVAVGSLLLLRIQMAPQDASVPLEAYRGAQTVTTLKAANPAQTAREISAVLAARGVPYRQVEQPDHGVRIEAKVARNDRDAIQSALSLWKIDIPENGILIVVVGR